MSFVLGVGLSLVVGIGLYFGAGVFSKSVLVVHLIRIGVPVYLLFNNGFNKVSCIILCLISFNSTSLLLLHNH